MCQTLRNGALGRPCQAADGPLIVRSLAIWQFGKKQQAELALQNPLDMPRVSRTMNQVQQLSERMVSKVQHRDATTDGLASARLLAQQGLNQRQ